MIQTFLIYSDWSTLLLRLVLALIFFAHGWSKIKNLKVTAQNFQAMGFKPGMLWGTIAALVEFIGSLLLMVGLFTSIVTLFMAIQMAVAALWKIKNKQSLVNGYELDLIMFVSALLLATLGGGMFSLDDYWRLRFF